MVLPFRLRTLRVTRTDSYFSPRASEISAAVAGPSFRKFMICSVMV